MGADSAELYRSGDLLGLSDIERGARDSVAAFVTKEVLPIIGRSFRDGVFPGQLVAPIAELGILGAPLHGYGCAGSTHVTYGLMLQELERADSGLRSFASVQGSLCMYPIHTFGSEEQKQRFLPEMAKGKLIGCFGLTEPNSGSDPASLSTRARRDGNDYVLNGSKAWITNGGIADLALIWAKVDDGDASTIRGFLVERGMKGFAAREIAGKHSLRASSTADLSLTDVRVPEQNVLPGVVGLKGPFSCLNQARAGIACAVTGAAIACFEAARDYTLQRRQFGKPLAAFQLTQARLAEMLQEIIRSQLQGLQLMRWKDQGKATPLAVSVAKRANVRAALEIAREARALLGANGVSDAYPPIRHALNLESVFTYEGTHEIHTLVMGKAITGLDAF